MASPNITEMVTVTLRNRSKTMADNVSNGNALLQRLNQSGNVRPADGGRTIVEPLEYAENATFQYYNGYETLNITPGEVHDAAEYAWKQAAVNVTASGLEVRVQNSGKEAIFNLLTRRIENAERTMKNKLSEGIYSDGTGSSGKQITGLAAQVALGGAGTVGGINAATYSFWQNQAASVTTSWTTQPTTDMQNLWIDCCRGNDKPDLIVADKISFQGFWGSLTDQQRFTDPNTAVRGFQSLKFNTADVVYDGDSGITSSYMYFLNTDYIFWRPHSGTNMVPLERRDSINQDALVVPIVFAGNLTCSNRSLQGVLSDVA